MCLTHPVPLVPPVGCLECVKRQLFRVGDDWYFLFFLGLIMALISFAMDFTVSRVSNGNYWLVVISFSRLNTTKHPSLCSEYSRMIIRLEKLRQGEGPQCQRRR